MGATRDFDRRHGTDTGGEIPVEMLDHQPSLAPHAVSYEATEPEVFRHMMRELPVDHAATTFVDLGSGKGRVVMMAAAYPFRRIIGVEASTVLHATGCANLRSWSRRGGDARRIELRNEDAATTELPSGACVLYLFNPFRERTLARLLLRIKWSLEAEPRDLWLQYLNPQCGHILERSRCLARVHVGRYSFAQGDYSVYRSHGASRGAR